MNTSPEGHRDRLRQRFRANPQTLSEAELLELLLTYAIPRRDVALLARALLNKFGSIANLLAADASDISEIDGLGEASVTLLQLVKQLPHLEEDMPVQSSKPTSQLTFLETPSSPRAKAKERPMRVFANDEIANTLDLLPKAAEFETLDGFKQYLNEKLPYNAAETRQRRANYVVERYFPDGTLDVPLTFYLARHTAIADLKPVIFYHLLKAEPITTKVAEDLVWPALPIGRVEREQMREFILRYLPDASASSQKNMLRSVFYAYDLLGIGSANDTTLRFQLRSGTLESFLYILTSVFPEPGMYSFEALYNSPVHRWLLWDREWIRQQLYNLQDFGVLAKVSEIDTVRQFSLSVDQRAALHLFFEHPERKQKSIREQAEHQNTGQEGQP